MGTTAQKLEYLGTTKSQLKDMINYGLDDNNKITNSTTFRNYVSSIFNAFLEALRTPDTLFTNLPKKSDTGAVISLNDTANAPMRIELGASELTQDGTPTPSSPQDIHTISGSNKVVVNGSQLFDYNDFKTKMATLTTTGTGNTFTISGTGKFEYTFNQDEQCTLSGTWSTTYLNGDAVVIYEDNTTGVILADYSGTSKTGTINLTTNSSKKIKTIRFWFYNSSNVTLTNFMINKGNQATTYEPYVSQEAEIDLKSSNNLSPVIENSIVVNAGTVAEYRTDGSYSVVSTGQNSSPVSSRKDLLNSYTIKSGDYLHIMNDTIPTSGTVQIVGFDSSNTQIFAVSINSIKKIQDLSSYAGKSISKIQFYITANCVCNINLTPMILNTNTTTNFIKYYNYGEYCKIGNYEDKFIRNSGKNLANYNDSSTTGNINVGDIKANTDYTLYLNIIGTTGFNLKYGSNGNTITTRWDQTGIKVYNFTTTESGILFINTFSSNNFKGFAEIMLVEGTYTSSTMPTYEPYGSNEWYIKKNIGKVVLDGTETGWSNLSMGANYKRTDVLLPYTPMNTGSRVYCLSNYFLYNNSYNTDTIGSCFISTIDNKIYVYPEQQDTLQNFKTWLTTHNTIIMYPLATPTYTQITGTLAEQLENVYQKLLSQAGQTNISQINNDLAFELDVSALME